MTASKKTFMKRRRNISVQCMEGLVGERGVYSAVACNGRSCNVTKTTMCFGVSRQIEQPGVGLENCTKNVPARARWWNWPCSLLLVTWDSTIKKHMWINCTYLLQTSKLELLFARKLFVINFDTMDWLFFVKINLQENTYILSLWNRHFWSSGA